MATPAMAVGNVVSLFNRYANMEVSYLLQRMESYRGLAILTTNMQDSIDAAFIRRIRFITRFPFPEYDQRYAIWQRVFPSGVPQSGLDYRKLARLSVAGGNIRSIALSAAFLAAAEGADANQPAAVTMERIYKAAKAELSKNAATHADCGDKRMARLANSVLCSDVISNQRL